MGNKMGELYFHYGTMGSSKSAELLIKAHGLRKSNINVEILKPTFDNRFSAGTVKSRVGIESPAMVMPDLLNYTPKPETHVVLVDEVQFFQPADIDRLVYVADELGKEVRCYGLITDSNQNMFPASIRLMEVGAILKWHDSTCQISGCLNTATHHLRFDKDNNVIRGGPQRELGDTNYKSVCRKHYNMIYYGHDKAQGR